MSSRGSDIGDACLGEIAAALAFASFLVVGVGLALLAAVWPEWPNERPMDRESVEAAARRDRDHCAHRRWVEPDGFTVERVWGAVPGPPHPNPSDGRASGRSTLVREYPTRIW